MLSAFRVGVQCQIFNELKYKPFLISEAHKQFQHYWQTLLCPLTNWKHSCTIQFSKISKVLWCRRIKLIKKGVLYARSNITLAYFPHWSIEKGQEKCYKQAGRCSVFQNDWWSRIVFFLWQDRMIWYGVGEVKYFAHFSANDSGKKLKLRDDNV